VLHDCNICCWLGLESFFGNTVPIGLVLEPTFSLARALVMAQGHHQPGARPAYWARLGRVTERDGDANLPQLCRLLLPGRDRQPCDVTLILLSALAAPQASAGPLRYELSMAVAY